MYLDQLLCLQTVTAEDGSQSKVFSLDLLFANGLSFAMGFVPTYFWVANLIPGVNGGKK